MKLLASKTSPYARKIRVLLAEKQLAFEFVEESAWNADTTVPRYNPLNKIPVLVTDDGTNLYDSSVIAEYLDPLGAPSFIPPAGIERARVRRDEALGNGITDAGIAIFLERKREAARQDPGVDRAPAQQGGRRHRLPCAGARRQGLPARRLAFPGRRGLRLRAALAGIPVARDHLAQRLRCTRALDREAGVAFVLREHPPAGLRVPAQAITPPPRHSSPR